MERNSLMRAPLLLAGLAAALAVAALVNSIFGLVSPPSTPDPRGADHTEVQVQLTDRGEITVYLVRQALERYEALGLDATLEYYNSPESVQGEWYVFIIDQSDKLIAHADQDLIGMDLKEELGVDITGYRFGDVMLGATEQGLWVDYIFLDPATGNREYKHVWVTRRDGLLFGSGWYQVLPTLPAETDKTLTILYWQAPSTPNPYLSGGFKDRDAGAITLQPLAYSTPMAPLSQPSPTKFPHSRTAASPRTSRPSSGSLGTTSSGPTAATSLPMTSCSPGNTAWMKPPDARSAAPSPT